MTQIELEPGWYPDPSGLPTRRWFDGNEWISQLAPLDSLPSVAAAGTPAGSSSVLTQARGSRAKWPWFLGVGLTAAASAAVVVVMLNRTPSETTGDRTAKLDVRLAVATLEVCNADAGNYPTSDTTEDFTGSIEMSCGFTSQTLNLTGNNEAHYESDGSSYTISVTAPDGNFTYVYDSTQGGSPVAQPKN